ncbi:hypothetical protein Tco_1478872, partial [Tanacetum coccineum]
ILGVLVNLGGGLEQDMDGESEHDEEDNGGDGESRSCVG